MLPAEPGNRIWRGLWVPGNDITLTVFLIGAAYLSIGPAVTAVAFPVVPAQGVVQPAPVIGRGFPHALEAEQAGAVMAAAPACPSLTQAEAAQQIIPVGMPPPADLAT